jgi:Asp-tRNA(Asn)/Glu-tRNA(Gln) amidotransferase A subunit family amidase
MKCFSWSLDTVGLFAAGVADVAFAAAAISGRDLRADGREPSAPAVGLLRTALWPEASADMQDAIEHAARKASASGAQIKEITLPGVFDEAAQAHVTIQDFEACRVLAFEFDKYRDRLSPALREQLDKAAAISPLAYDEARRLARRARQAFGGFMTDADVILTPSAPGAAPHGLGSTGKPIFNRLWTLLGTPCVNVPGLVDPTGLPLGVQVVGRFARDRNALEAALFLERALAR